MSRGVPTKEELLKTVLDICSNNKIAQEQLAQGDDSLLSKFATGYQTVCDMQKRQFFGLRDLYSLVKMVFLWAVRDGMRPSELDQIRAVQRNFSGYCRNDFQPIKVFLEAAFGESRQYHLAPKMDLIWDALQSNSSCAIENRYLLLLTKNNIALRIIQESGLLKEDSYQILFGSAFPQDQEYTQICSNIKQIQNAMMTGDTIILCNLDILYESLYDVLNQSYSLVSGERFTDIGLGTHRLKSKVHKEFRMILLAEENVVMETFSTPLINRLEKHQLVMSTMLDESQAYIVTQIEEWAEKFAKLRNALPSEQQRPGDTIIGYHNDFIAGAVLGQRNSGVDIKKHATSLLLKCATPDAVARLNRTKLLEEEKREAFNYYLQRHPTSLEELVLELQKHSSDDCNNTVLYQVTSHSPMLSAQVRKDLEVKLFHGEKTIDHLTLDQMKTQDQFKKKLKLFFKKIQKGVSKMLLIEFRLKPTTQTTFIDCVRYCVLNEITEFQRQYLQPTANAHGNPAKTAAKNPPLLIGLILHIPRQKQLDSIPLPGRPWQSFHIDELTGDSMKLSNLSILHGKNIASIFQNGPDNLIPWLLTDATPKAISKMNKPTSKEGQGHSRIQKRLEILLEHFRNDKSWLRQALTKIVQKSIQETEQNNDNENNWSCGIATSNEHMKDGHTFAKTIKYHLQDVVANHLKAAVETLDIHNGLNLGSDDSPSWAKNLFYELATNHSKQLQTLASTCQGQVANASMTAHFPFSWAVVETLDKYYFLNQTNPGVDLLIYAFDDESFAQPLNEVCFEYADAREAFVRDIIMMKKGRHIGAHDQDSLKPIVQAILLQAIKDSRTRGQSQRTGSRLTIVDIFNACQKVEKELDVLFQAISSSGSTISEVVPMSSPHESMDDDFSLHQVAVLHCLKKLKPPDDLDQRGFQIWLAKCATTGQLVQNFCVVQGREELLSQIKVLWKRVKIVSLFLDFIWNQDMEVTADKKAKIRGSVSLKASNLWFRLGDGKDLFEKILSFLQKTSSDVAKEVYRLGNLDVCIRCRKPIKLPVALTCSHVGCKNCIKKRAGQDAIECPAPGCGATMEDDFQAVSSVSVSEALMEHKSFRQGITACFQEILQEHVFQTKESHLPGEEVCKMLLDCVFYKNADSKRTKTKDMSPFPCDSIDRHPRVRSFIVQLILQTDFNNGMEFLDKMFISQVKTLKETVSRKEQTELSLLLLTCIEDHLRFDEGLNCDMLGTLTSWMSEMKSPSLCETQNQSSHQNEAISPVVIMSLAKIRLACETMAKVIGSALQNNQVDKDKAALIINIWKRVDNNSNPAIAENMIKFVVRAVVSRYSHDYILLWRANDQLRPLLPPAIRDADKTGMQDFFLALGQDYPAYKKVRDGLRNALLFERDEGLQQAIVGAASTGRLEQTWQLACNFVLHVDDSPCSDGVDSFVQRADQDDSLEYQDLMETTRSAASVDVATFWRQFQSKAVKTLMMHLEVMLDFETNDSPSLGTLAAFSQGGLGKTFLPTIPQDEKFEAISTMSQVVGDEFKTWYSCACGNYFIIGDCGKPYTVSTCHCGRKIGGERHELPSGSGQAKLGPPKDCSVQGHNLLLEPEKTNPAIGVRLLTGLEVAVIRFILHGAMLLGCQKSRDFFQDLMGKSREQHPDKDLLEFLSANFRQISQSLGKSEEFAQLLLHNVISAMAQRTTSATAANKDVLDSQWRSKTEVNLWETEFARAFIKPSLVTLDRQMELFRQEIRNDDGMACKSLLDILDERGGGQEANGVEPNIPQVQQPQFWHPREGWVTTASLRHKIGDDELKNKCPNLDRMLKRQNELSYVVHLPEILELQYTLTEHFNYALDVTDLRKMTTGQFLDEHYQGNKHIQDLAGRYLCLVRQMKQDGWLDTRRLKIDNTNIDLTSECSILFPSDHGYGPVAREVAKTLVRVHNEMMATYRRGKEAAIPQIHPSNIKDVSQLIHYNETTLNRLIQTNSEYDFELSGRGRPVNWRLDKERLEATLVHR